MTRGLRVNRPASSALGRLLRHGDIPYRGVIALAALCVIGLMVGVGIMLWTASGPSRDTLGVAFVTGSEWNPVDGIFGALPFIIGTLATSVVALIVAVPLGLGVAVFLSELCPERLRVPLGFMVELLAAIPSVVYGAWGIFVFIPAVVKPLGAFLMNTFGDKSRGLFLPIFEGPFFGASSLAAGLILAVMVVPTITAISRDVLKAVPSAQRDAAYGLGSTQWETIW
ncbi:MAG TPA: ABC transporter permease subunit, partial [Anaerolineae bacterium]